ncbi:MAG: hypothetical protein IPP29_21310 [Bacteroidetes bacterium]|nr:hypothetical protein [Bacteroidota bacterium]
MDGSDAGADEMNAFLMANLPLMEAWVTGGGKLFLNSAPNEGGNINFGFGGTTLLYGQGPYSDNANVSAGQSGHPIFNGPNVCGSSWSGTSFGHAIVGGTLTSLIDGDAPGVVMGEAVWGAGKVIFGGMTQSFFHSPSPEAGFLRQNIHHYLGTGGLVV